MGDTRTNGLLNETRRFRHAALALRLIWGAASRWTIVWAVLLLIQGLIPAGIIILTKFVVDAAAAAIGGGVTWTNALPVILPAVGMGGLMLLQRVLGSVNEWISTAQAELVSDHIKGLIHERAAAADFGFYESSEYHDQLEQVNTQASSRTLQLLGSLGGILQTGVTFLSIAAILIAYAWWLPLALLVSTLPAFAVIIRHNRKYHGWWKESTPRRRLTHYYDLMLTLDQAAGEVRLYGLGGGFRERYQALRRLLRTERLDLLKRQVIARFGAAMIGLLVTAGALVWIGLRALRGLATIGDLALFYQAFNQGQSLVGGLLQNVGQIYTNTLFLEHLFAFLGQGNTVDDPPDPLPFPQPVVEGVRFENVTFAYPGFERAVLEDFSLELPAGKMVAIVGPNGAGKSTFVKLLCRFYDPNAGRVTVDGIDLRRFRQAELRRHISVMFQFPMKYQMTATENIRLGDTHSGRTQDEIVAAAQAGGAHETIMKLPHGYDSLLGRWFATGTELSGGEWQRMALARAYLRRAPIVVLDEPTSFMDSWAETEWLQRFKKLVRDQTTLIITHRFTTAMQADVIHVMDNGRVVESGTHDQLLSLEGRYAQSWRAQMRQAQIRETSAGNGTTN